MIDGPGTMWGQLLILALMIVGILVIMLQGNLRQAFLVKQWEAHRELEREQRVALIREAMRPPKVDTHPTIMVIEDNEPMLTLTKRQLEQEGYKVRATASAEAALASLAHAPGGLPDLIVVDLRLPRMSGIDFVKQLRWSGCRMPIIAYTAYGSGLGEEGARPTAIAAGCNEFVLKGEKTAAGESSLLQTIARWLEITHKLEGRWDA